jgi:hypothetical protein
MPSPLSGTICRWLIQPAVPDCLPPVRQLLGEMHEPVAVGGKAEEAANLHHRAVHLGDCSR